MRIFEVAGPQHAVYVFGVKLLGVNAENGRKLLLTLAVIAITWVLVRILRWITQLSFHGRTDIRAHFWSRQAIHLIATAVFVLAAASIWFDRPGRFTASAGLITAGVAVALQRVLTAVAAYFVILRGRVFNVGDRIAMAGVRGDVIALGYTRTTIMEMGQAPGEQESDPSMWVEARQYTGRVVTVTNDKIFDEPVYNYSRMLPYIWEEMTIPVPHGSDHARAEEILLNAASRHASFQGTQEQLAELQRRYALKPGDEVPRVYLRLTDNWIELTVRFLVPDHGIRPIKDAITRDILRDFAAGGLTIASTTVALVEAPTITVVRDEAPRPGGPTRPGR
jgi:small-conductance mechanosensitive channel